MSCSLKRCRVNTWYSQARYFRTFQCSQRVFDVWQPQAHNGFPRIHGFVYDIGEGLLKKLNIDFKAEVAK